MEKLFGIPVETLTIVMVAILLIFMAVIAFFANRNRALVKLGVRNIPRRRGQSVLIVLGLMLSTAIIASALAIGDTVSSSIRGSALDALGATDIEVRAPAFVRVNNEYISEENVRKVLAAADSHELVDGAMPQIRTELPIVNDAAERTSIGLPVLGIDTQRMGGFDEIRTTRGEVFDVSSLGPAGILLNETMAADLEAGAGDQVTVIAPTGRHEFTVAAVVEEKGLSGVRGNVPSNAVAVVQLAAMQSAMERPGQANRIEISVEGGLRPDEGVSKDAADDLRIAFSNDDIADSLFEILSEPAAVAAIEEYLASNEDLPALVTEDLEELVSELKEGGEPSRRFRSLITKDVVAGSVALSLEDSGQSQQAFAATIMFAQLETVSVGEIKNDVVEIADLVGGFFTTIFGIFGSFSIMVGLLLIFLVFVMLAASRTTEMGIARAVGMKRQHLVQAFIYEGAAYAFASSIAGVLLGIFASLALIELLIGLVPEDINFTIRFGLQPRSLLLAFAAGMVVTLITVAFSAYRVSKLNISVAIRGLPEEFVPTSTPSLSDRLIQLGIALLGPLYNLYRLIVGGSRVRSLVMFLLHLTIVVWLISIIVATYRLLSPYVRLGWPVTVVGVLITMAGVNASSAATFSIGASLICISIGQTISLILSRTELREDIVARISFSAGSILLLILWLLPNNALDSLTGELSGNLEMFILSGVFLTGAAVTLVMYNADVVLWPVSRFLGPVGGMRPVLKAALSYPLESRFRTGLTIAMFALIVFTLMVFAAITEAFNNAIVNNVERINGGYDIRASISKELPIEDIDAAIADSPSLNPEDFQVVGGRSGSLIEARQVGPYLGKEIEERRFLRMGIVGLEDSLISSTLWEFSHFDPAYGSNDAEIWAALLADPDLAVVGAGVLVTGDPFSAGGDTSFKVQDIESNETGDITAFQVEIRGDQGGAETITKTVIGITDSLAFQQSTLIGTTALIDEVTSVSNVLTTYHFRLSPGAEVDAVSSALENAFLDHNMNAAITLDEINRDLSANRAFNLLFQGFVGLGLFVGVASLGVVMVRAVVERTQAIGMLRAIGFRESMIRTSFLLESSFIALAGIGLGLLLGTVISWQVVSEINREFGGLAFSIPWLTVMTIVAVSWVFSLTTTFLPARQASKVYPAEALRYE